MEIWSPSYLLIITATDANNPSNSASATYRLPIRGNTTLSDGTVGIPYPEVRLVTGGSVTPDLGSLPPGLSITQTGPRFILGGIPERAGTYVFQFIEGSRYTVTILSRPEPTISTINPSAGPPTGGTSVTITGTNLTGATSVTIGGAPAASFTVDSATQITAVTPSGKPGSVDVAVATLGGTATAIAGFTYQGSPSVMAMNPASGSALPLAMAGEDYSHTIRATGGVGAILYDIVGGDLPDGMVLNVSTGELTGPLGADTQGTYSFTVEARDSDGGTARANYSITVAERAVTVVDQEISVPDGGTPPNVNLTRGATGGPFWSAAVVSVEPSNAGEARIVDTEYAQAGGGGTPMHFYLKFTPNSAFSGQARVNFQLSSSLGTSNLGTVTYNLGYDPVAVVDEVDSLVRGFVQTRQNLIASTINVPGLLERRRMGAAKGPVSSSVSPSNEGLTLNFAANLAQRSAGADGGDGISEAGESSSSPFNVWIDGTLMFHNREQNGNRWGSFGMVSAGADYLITNRALVGLSFHYDRMTDPTDHDAQLAGNGWLAGPYASVEIGRGVFWDTSLLYGGSSNTIDTGFWDGSFDTRRWLFNTSISGQWQLDEVTVLTPKLRGVYLNEEVQDYAIENGSNGVLDIEGFTTEQLRVSLGAEIARQFTVESGSILTPKLGVIGGFSGLDGSGAFGQIYAGLDLQTPEDWTIDGGLLFDIENNGQTAVGARIGAGVRF